MNPVESAGCRIVQTAFKLALPLLPYRDPQILKSVDMAAATLVYHNKTNALIVTDKSIHGLGLVDGLKAALARRDIDFIVYDETVPNPTVSNVEAARLLYLDHGCDCIIAFGGGSSMDCAKACGARIARPRKHVRKMRGVLKILRKTPLLMAVPTTAGTGSETTLAAVITDDETHYKYPINDFPLIPSYAVLDWRTTVGLPKAITATTGIDALVHAVEAYIGRSTTKETRAYAIEAVDLIRRYLKIAYDEPHNEEARTAMLHAANRAGLAFSKSYVGYVHAVAHSLGGQYGTPHGLANAIICPHVLEMYGDSCHKRLGELARKSGVAHEDTGDAEASASFIQWFKDLNASMGIPAQLEGIREQDIAMMARHANAEANPLYPVPKLMNTRELEAIYRKIMA